MKKTEKKTSATNELMIDFATLATDLKDYAATLDNPDYVAFVERIAATVEMNSLKFAQFVKAIEG